MINTCLIMGNNVPSTVDSCREWLVRKLRCSPPGAGPHVVSQLRWILGLWSWDMETTSGRTNHDHHLPLGSTWNPHVLHHNLAPATVQPGASPRSGATPWCPRSSVVSTRPKRTRRRRRRCPRAVPGLRSRSHDAVLVGGAGGARWCLVGEGLVKSWWRLVGVG